MVKLVRATGGNTTHNTGEMLPMATGKRRISLAVRGLAAKVAGSRVLEPERAPVAAELELDRVAAERALVRVEVALGPDLVAVALELDLVAVELELDPVAAELEHDPVAVERELGRVEAVAAPGHPRGHLAVPPGTKLVIAAHRRGLPLLAAEDLVVAAEITREPAATEAAGAWEAAE